MEILDLNKLSPLRVFEQSLEGGLGKGNLGVLVSRRGIGKTACLVHLAMYKMYAKQLVIHVSFSNNVQHVLNWYDEYLKELKDGKSTATTEEYNSILSNRSIMNFNQNGLSVDNIINSIKALILQGAFKANAILFDGYKLNELSKEDLKKIKDFAKELQLECWLSVSASKNDNTYDEFGVPTYINEYKDLIDLLIGLKYDEKKEKVVMTAVKHNLQETDKPLNVYLNPKTMLIED